MTAITDQARQARGEDVAFMATWGETATEAARRLGLDRASLGKWCHTHAPEAWAQLLANEERRGRFQ